MTANPRIRTLLSVGLLIVVGGIVPIAIASHFGALGIARNDDWTYFRSVFLLADKHELNGGASTTNLVGQLALSLPVVWAFGHRLAALQIEVAALGVVGLVAVFDLAKQLISPSRALFVALLVAVGPMWASLSASYMSDIPGFALAMVCLALGARGIRTDGLATRYFYSSLAVGFLAFTVREYAIVAPLAVGAAALLADYRSPHSRRRPIAISLTVVVVLALLFYSWRQSLPGFANPGVHRTDLAAIKLGAHTFAQSTVLVGILVFPAALVAGPWRTLRAAWRSAPVLTIALGVASALALLGEEVRLRNSSNFLGPGNYVLANGTLGTTILGKRYDLFPRSLLALLVVFGVLSAVTLLLAAIPPIAGALAAIRRRQFSAPKSPTLAIVLLATLGYAVLVSTPVLLGFPTADRYLIVLIPLVGTLLLYTRPSDPSTPRGSLVAGSVALGVFAVVSVAFAANRAAFDGTQWRVATRAVTVAKDPRRVDGSYAWNNYHADNPSSTAVSPERACIVLHPEQRPAEGDKTVVGFGRVWGPRGTQVWVVARRRGPC